MCPLTKAIYSRRYRRVIENVREKEIPRIVIAGTHSGCGKTTVAQGVMAVLMEEGLAVQPFKVGPDFIDPTHHTAICHRPSRNLDPFMMGEEGVVRTFLSACRGADIAVIEGVMGLFDGLGGTSLASTAHVCRILSAPAILVVDAKGMSRSANAVVKGFIWFEEGVTIAGAIYNNVGSVHHREMIGSSLPVPAFGYITKREDLAVGSRHLGLKMAHETENLGAQGRAVRECCDIPAILAAARFAPAIPDTPIDIGTGNNEPCGPVIGVAKDEAFCFYYLDNLDRLAASGAALRFFSPLHDPLPEVDALYLGGGYPELHADGLSVSGCTESIRKRAEEGMPIYAECGGLLYLAEELEIADRTCPMAGVLPARAVMTGRIGALGYTEGTFREGAPFCRPGMPLRGHEFHYSRVECRPDAKFAITLLRGKGIHEGADGLYEHQTVGTYTHAYFNDEFAKSFVQAAEMCSRC